MSLADSVCPNENCTGKLIELNNHGHVVCSKCSQVVQSQNHWLTLCRTSTIDTTRIHQSLEAAGY